MSLCDAARVHAICALIRSVLDQKVTISFAFIYRELVKHRLSGNDAFFSQHPVFLADTLSHVVQVLLFVNYRNTVVLVSLNMLVLSIRHATNDAQLQQFALYS